MALTRSSSLLLRPLALLTIGSLAAAAPALAQVESYLWGPGSNVGPASKVEPRNCVTAADGTITCDTEIVNPPGDTPARQIGRAHV